MDKDLIKTIDDYLSKSIILFVPGLMNIEIIFHKGLFSGGINDFYSFFLLILWSILFSTPYYFFTFFISSKYGPTEDEVGDEFGITDIALPISFILMLFSFFTFKYISYLEWFSILQVYEIDPKYLIHVISILFSGIITIPIGKFYYWGFGKLSNMLK